MTLHRLLACKARVTPGMALRLGRYCGNGAELWLRMQNAHDLWHGRHQLRDVLEKIPAPDGEDA